MANRRILVAALLLSWLIVPAAISAEMRAPTVGAEFVYSCTNPFGAEPITYTQKILGVDGDTVRIRHRGLAGSGWIEKPFYNASPAVLPFPRTPHNGWSHGYVFATGRGKTKTYDGSLRGMISLKPDVAHSVKFGRSGTGEFWRYYMKAIKKFEGEIPSVGTGELHEINEYRTAGGYESEAIIHYSPDLGMATFWKVTERGEDWFECRLISVSRS